MQTVGIRTAQNIDIDYNVAGLGERIIARIIDYALYLTIFLLYTWIFSWVHSAPVLMNYTFPEILYFIFYAFYDLIAEIFFNGQSIGKYIMKIKVISIDGSRPRFGQYVIRYIFRAVDFVLTLGIGAIVSVALTDNKQRIGDIVAGTTLIKTKVSTAMDELSYADIDMEYEPVFKEVMSLNDQDITLIREVIKNFLKTGNDQLLESMGSRIKVHLDIVIPSNMNMYKFLDTVLKDYNCLTTDTEHKLL